MNTTNRWRRMLDRIIDAYEDCDDGQLARQIERARDVSGYRDRKRKRRQYARRKTA